MDARKLNIVEALPVDHAAPLWRDVQAHAAIHL
jgi:hypothetical protein